MTTLPPYEKTKVYETDCFFNEAEFQHFFKNNFTALCTFCNYRYGFALDTAKEAVHTAFIKLWENRQSVSPTLPVKAYMYTIVSNVCIDMLRHKKVQKQHEKYLEEHAHDNAEGCEYNRIDFNEMKKDVEQAVRALPAQMRAVFVLSRYEGLKYMEIATQLGISVKTVETQMSRALVKLRQSLVQYLPLCLLPFID